MSVNKAILVGNVGKEPEVRYLESGVPVCNFPMATNEIYTKNGEKKTITEWHNIVLWRGLAQVAEKYVKKGTQLYIEGRIRTRNYDDKEGNKRYITEIIGDNMQMLGKRGGDSSETSNASSPNPPSSNQQPDSQGDSQFNNLPSGNETGDDLPF
jgi:single-strand DNA-binding protein